MTRSDFFMFSFMTLVGIRMHPKNMPDMEDDERIAREIAACESVAKAMVYSVDCYVREELKCQSSQVS